LSCDSAEEEEEQEDVPAESPVPAPASTTTSVWSQLNLNASDLPPAVMKASEPDEVPEPSTVQEARASPFASEWESALQDEWNALVANETFTLIPQHDVPRGRTVIPSKVVFKVKRNRDNSIERFKCRIVAKGFRQRPGLDFHEVFSPTVSKDTVRLLLAVAARLQWEVDHVDVKNAFLAADLKEEIYMSPPPGISCVDRDGNVLVCLLHKSIYGLKQSPREFNELLDAAMKAAGLSRSESDPCLYILSDKDGAVLALVVTYVDDILVAGKQRSLVDHVKAKLSSKFQLSDLGPVHHFLGVSVDRDIEARILSLNQLKYIHQLLRRFGMSESRPVYTPLATGTQLVQAKDDSELLDDKDKSMYQEMVGSLLYLSCWTRGDLAATVSQLSRYMSSPTQDHLVACKHCLRYVRATAHLQLVYGAALDFRENMNLLAYADADWAGDKTERKSTSGYIIMLGTAAVAWRSAKQDCIALSSTESEYISLCLAVQEIKHLRNLLKDMGQLQTEPTVVLEDNQACIHLAEQMVTKQQSKHIDIKFHFTRHAVRGKIVEVRYCPTADMTADLLTKILTREKTIKFRLAMGLS